MTETQTPARRREGYRGWRDENGFGRPVEVEAAVYAVTGADDEQHAVACDFIEYSGILPCSCDAMRGRHRRDESRVGKSWWFRCWIRWQEVRVYPGQRRERIVPWPVHGPDGEPWVPGVDFNDAPDRA